MPAITKSDVVAPQQLSAGERQRLVDELYAVHCQIFDGVDKAAFAKYVVESSATCSRIQLHKDSQGCIVGYCAVHVFELELRATPATVFRMEAGTLRHYRGRNTNARFAIEQFVRYWLAHPTRPLFYLGTLVHPSSYMLFAKYAAGVWPNRERPLSPQIAALMADLAAAFELEPVDPQNPLVVHVGWRTRDTEVERDYWRSCDKPAARFFVRENPNYSLGHGLMTLVPLSGSGVLRVAGRVVADRVQRSAEATFTTMHGLPLARRLFGAGDIRRRLERVPLFAGVSADDLAAVARAAEVVTSPAGTLVFREGDPGTALYVIASGSVYVLVDRSGEETVIDQLATGAMFGEIAMLGGETRTASIRTATTTTLIRLHRETLLAFMDTHGQTRDAIWRAFAMRRFLDAVDSATRFRALSRQQRLQWFSRSTHEPLARGAEATIADPWLFILTGAVEIDQNGSWLTLQAPALIEVTSPLRVVALVSSRILRMPAVAEMVSDARAAVVAP